MPDIVRHIEVTQASTKAEGEARTIVIGKDPWAVDPMTNVVLHAQYWVHERRCPPVEKVAELATRDQVDAFVALLAGEDVSDAILIHSGRPRFDTAIPDDEHPVRFLTMPDHSMNVGIHGGRGALSYHGHGVCRRQVQPQDHSHRGARTGPVGTEKSGDLSGLDSETQVVDGTQVTELLRQTTRLDHVAVLPIISPISLGGCRAANARQGNPGEHRSVNRGAVQSNERMALGALPLSSCVLLRLSSMHQRKSAWAVPVSWKSRDARIRSAGAGIGIPTDVERASVNLGAG
ncbi:hypothetical protein BAY61_04970 [Prauserella marina]|nr:hypothetical protein BAY61_04970 [Prauserella marina]